MQNYGAKFQWIHLQDTPTPMAQATLQMWQKDYKSQKSSCEIMFPTNIRNYNHKVSTICLPKCELKKDDITEHNKLDSKNHMKT